MPQERDSQFPATTAEEIEAAPGTREEKSARFVIVRHITGNVRRGYLLGDCDPAPIYRGVSDLTAAAWAVIDAIHDEQHTSEEDRGPKERATMDAVDRLEAILCDHGCPEGDTA